MVFIKIKMSKLVARLTNVDSLKRDGGLSDFVNPLVGLRKPVWVVVQFRGAGGVQQKVHLGIGDLDVRRSDGCTWNVYIIESRDC